jgi:hypothetical protein
MPAMLSRPEDHDPLLHLWIDLTGRALTPALRRAFVQRVDARALRDLMAQHGRPWMTAAGRRCIKTGEDGETQLKLADWLKECRRVLGART